MLGRGVVQFLHVGGNDDGGHGPPGTGRTHGSVDDVRQLFGDGHHLAVLRRHVLVEAEQVDLLLIAAAHGAPVRLAHDGNDRHMVKLGVVQAVEEVDGTRARGRRAHADLAGELGVSDRFECGHLLVPGLDEPWLVLRASPGGKQAADAVTGVGEDMVNVPFAQSLQNEVGYLDRH